MRKATKQMERDNMRDRLAEVWEAFGKERFTIPKALGKMTAAGSLDMIEQLAPVGLSFAMTANALESLLRAGNLEEIACWIVELKDGTCEIIAPLLEQT
eukprot:1236738-Rhodomonas_salina.1